MSTPVYPVATPLVVDTLLYTAELVEVPCGMWTLAGPKNRLLARGPDTPKEGTLLEAALQRGLLLKFSSILKFRGRFTKYLTIYHA